MVKIGVIGAGHLGRLILKQLDELPELFSVSGYYDSNPNISALEPEMRGWIAFPSALDLIKASDALILSVPTRFHYLYAREILDCGKHLFIEKPITDTLEEAVLLKEYLRDKPWLIVQVGHIERFNPAWLSIKNLPLNPMFLEVHRLAPFNSRGTDVSVVLDLMIHDLDLILQLIPHEISEIRANGVAILSPSPDIANARIEFKNGAVANVTASRISLKKMRKMRMFQKDGYLSLDFLEKKCQIISPLFSDSELKTNSDSANNALKEELKSFGEAIMYQRKPVVTVDDGLNALSLAFKILNKIR
jgi:predicted dehydrogenase